MNSEMWSWVEHGGTVRCPWCGMEHTVKGHIERRYGPCSLCNRSTIEREYPLIECKCGKRFTIKAEEVEE